VVEGEFMEDKPKKPELVLARPNRESLIAMFTKLAGREPSAQELADAEPAMQRMEAKLRAAQLSQPQDRDLQPSPPEDSTGSTALLAQLRRMGRPLTKVEYLKVMLHGEDPTFPLDAEIAAAVPNWLDGELPESIEEMYPKAFPKTAPRKSRKR
jgi:hypothetical protein